MKMIKITNKTFFIKPKVKYYDYTSHPNLFIYLNIFGDEFNEENLKKLNDISIVSDLYDCILNEYQFSEIQKEKIKQLVNSYLQGKPVKLDNQFDAFVWNIINRMGVCINEYGLVRINYEQVKELEPIEFQVLVILQDEAVRYTNQRLKVR